jgi:hypothetical protein
MAQNVKLRVRAPLQVFRVAHVQLAINNEPWNGSQNHPLCLLV